MPKNDFKFDQKIMTKFGSKKRQIKIDSHDEKRHLKAEIFQNY